MRMYDIIAIKRDGGTLTRAEIAFAVPKVCTLLCGLPKDVVSPWAKLLETVAIMATLYYVFQSAKRHAAALQQASQNG